MGDTLDDFDEAYIQNSEDSDEEDRVDGGSDLEDDEEQKKALDEQKNLKRKQRIKALKEKKKAKIESDTGNNADEQEGQLLAEEMLSLIETHIPAAMANTKSSLFDASGAKKTWSEEHFFSPQLDPQGVTESLTKKSCPFVRALSVSLPGYKKLLFSQNANPSKSSHSNSNESYSNEVSSELFGCPVVLIVAASALRCTQIIKSISAKLIKVKVAKLFAKHIKVSEQITMLSKEYFPVAIGTPNRLQKLIELGALHLQHSHIVLVDYTADLKHFTILTQPDIVQDWYMLLYQSLHEHREHLKIALVKDKQTEGGEEKGQQEQKKNPTPSGSKAPNLQRLKFIKERQKKKHGGK